MPSITVLRAFWRNTNLPPVVHVTTKKPYRLLGSATRGSRRILSVVCPAVGFNIEEVPDHRYRRSVVQRGVSARTRMPLPFAGTGKGVSPVCPLARGMPRAWMPVRRASSPSGFITPIWGFRPFRPSFYIRVTRPLARVTVKPRADLGCRNGLRLRFRL